MVSSYRTLKLPTTISVAPIQTKNTPSAKRRRRRFWSSCITWVKRLVSKCVTPVSVFYQAHYLDSPKAFIRKSRIHAWPLFIHTLTIVSGIILSVLNLQGRFEGYKFASASGDGTQAFTILSLQVCAKFIEITVQASLAFVILSFISYCLFFAENGLPLGLSGTRANFTNIFFIFSPSFATGIRNLGTIKQRILGAFLIVSCGLLATFVGPSSALLLIPTIRTGWPGGAAQIPSYTPISSLYPTRLDNLTVHLSNCMWPSEHDVGNPSDDLSPCPWFLTTNISLEVKSIDPLDGTYMTFTRSWTVHDFGWRRAINYTSVTSTRGIWATSAESHMSILGNAMFELWRAATAWSSALADSTHPARWYFLRIPDQTSMEMTGFLPAVRTRCFVQKDISFNMSNVITYPILPLYDYGRDQQYHLQPPLINSTSKPISSWLKRPDSTTMDSRIASDFENGYFPSAVLTVQIPDDSTVHGKVVACSVAARWAQGLNKFSDIEGGVSETSICSPQFKSNARPLVSWHDINEWLPADDGTWSTVDLDTSWLNVLTLSYNTSSNGSLPDHGWQCRDTDSQIPVDSISRFLMTDSLAWNSTLTTQNVFDTFVSNSWPLHQLELFVSMLITDAMSRANLQDAVVNDWQGTLDSFDDTSITTQVYDPLLRGNFIWPQKSASNNTKVDYVAWRIFIAGYAYKADSTAYYLALVVVMYSMLLAVGHIVYMFRSRWSSSVWDSVSNILTLALESPQTTVKRDHKGFVGSYMAQQSRLIMRVHALDNSANDPALIAEDGGASKEDKVHLVVRNGEASQNRQSFLVDYRKVVPGKMYG